MVSVIRKLPEIKSVNWESSSNTVVIPELYINCGASYLLKLSSGNRDFNHQISRKLDNRDNTAIKNACFLAVSMF